MKSVVRKMVMKVSRRLAPRNRRRSRTNNKEGGANNDNQQDNQDDGNVDQSQTHFARRGRNRRGGYSAGGYFIEPGKIHAQYTSSSSTLSFN